MIYHNKISVRPSTFLYYKPTFFSWTNREKLLDSVAFVQMSIDTSTGVQFVSRSIRTPKPTIVIRNCPRNLLAYKERVSIVVADVRRFQPASTRHYAMGLHGLNAAGRGVCVCRVFATQRVRIRNVMRAWTCECVLDVFASCVQGSKTHRRPYFCDEAFDVRQTHTYAFMLHVIRWEI